MAKTAGMSQCSANADARYAVRPLRIRLPMVYVKIMPSQWAYNIIRKRMFGFNISCINILSVSLKRLIKKIDEKHVRKALGGELNSDWLYATV